MAKIEGFCDLMVLSAFWMSMIAFVITYFLVSANVVYEVNPIQAYFQSFSWVHSITYTFLMYFLIFLFYIYMPKINYRLTYKKYRKNGELPYRAYCITKKWEIRSKIICSSIIFLFAFSDMTSNLFVLTYTMNQLIMLI